MKKTSKNLLNWSQYFYAILALLTFNFGFDALAGKGGNKPGGGGGGKGGSDFVSRFFDVNVEEYLAPDLQTQVSSADEVFWGGRCGAIGMIENDYPNDRILMTASSSSQGQPVELSNILSYLVGGSDLAEIESCFPGIISNDSFVALGTVVMTRDDDSSTPDVEEVTIQKAINGGYSKSGKQMHYTLYVVAEPELSGLWNPLGLDVVGLSDSLILYEWYIQATSGKPSRGCEIFGTFNGQVRLTVTRREGAYVEGECP